MEIIDDLIEEYWTRGDPIDTSGYQHYRVMKCEKPKPGTFAYGVFADDGMLRRVILEHGTSSRDPLKGACNIQLRLAEEDETLIIGVIIEDECVLLRSHIKAPPEPEVPVTNGDAEETQVNGDHEEEDAVPVVENATLDDIFGDPDEDEAPRENIFVRKLSSVNNNSDDSKNLTNGASIGT